MKKLIVIGLLFGTCFYNYNLKAASMAGLVGAVVQKPLVFTNLTGFSVVIKSGSKQIVVPGSAAAVKGSINKTLANDFANKTEIYISLVVEKNGKNKEDYSTAWPIKISANKAFDVIYIKYGGHTSSSPQKTGEPNKKIFAVRDEMSTILADISDHPKGKGGLFSTTFWW